MFSETLALKIGNRSIEVVQLQFVVHLYLVAKNGLRTKSELNNSLYIQLNKNMVYVSITAAAYWSKTSIPMES